MKINPRAAIQNYAILKLNEANNPRFVARGITAFHEGQRSQQVALAAETYYAEEMLQRSLTSFGASEQEVNNVIKSMQRLIEANKKLFQVLEANQVDTSEQIGTIQDLLSQLKSQKMTPADASIEILRYSSTPHTNEDSAAELDNAFKDLHDCGVSHHELISSINTRLNELSEPEIVELQK